MFKELLLDVLPLGINDGFELVERFNGIGQLNGDLDFFSWTYLLNFKAFGISGAVSHHNKALARILQSLPVLHLFEGGS